MEQVRKSLPSEGTLGTIDVVSGATFSSKAIVRAYYAALEESAKKAGSSFTEPTDSEDPDSHDPSSTDDDHGTGNSDEDAGGSEGDGTGDSQDGEGDGESSETPGDGTDDPGMQGNLVDGTYTGHGLCEDPTYEDEWDAYYVLVTIDVRDGVVRTIANVHGDTEGKVNPGLVYDISNATYLNRAIKGTTRVTGVVGQIQARLNEGKPVQEIDVVSGATFSSRAIIDGYNNALAQAQPAD